MGIGAVSRFFEIIFSTYDANFGNALAVFFESNMPPQQGLLRARPHPSCQASQSRGIFVFLIVAVDSDKGSEV